MPSILDQFGKPIPRRRRPQDLSARYDAARTHTGNERHWVNSDGLSANAANNPAVRDRLRKRARYECLENNSYGLGIVLTLANDTIGTGPRLQLHTPNRQANQFLERQFSLWAKATRFAAKLTVMRLAKCVDGETVALLTTNPGIGHSVKLDVKPLEADRLATPFLDGPSDRAIDGIRFDSHGNRTAYTILRSHPGSDYVDQNPTQTDTVAAENVIHWFRCLRPEQERGVPEVTPALPLFAQLRRYTLATIAAAETAADMAGVVHTNATVGDPDDVEPMDAIEIEMRQLLTLPQGWDISQLKAEHPSTTYQMFKREILNEIARCLNMPYNVAAADSSSYNYASGRMDHQVYGRSIDVERSDAESGPLDHVLSQWLEEAALAGLVPETPAMTAGRLPPTPQLQEAAAYLDILGHDGVSDWLRGGDTVPYLPDVILASRALRVNGFVGAAATLLDVPHEWQWDGREHVDPTKEADGQKTRLTNGTTTRRRELARAGRDIDEADQEAAADYGITVEEYRKRILDTHFPAASSASSGPASEDGEDEDESEAAERQEAAA